MNSMQQGHDLCILWNLKSVQDHISAKRKKRGCILRKYEIFFCPLTNQNGTPTQPQENECSLIIRDKDAGLLTIYKVCRN